MQNKKMQFHAFACKKNVRRKVYLFLHREWITFIRFNKFFWKKSYWLISVCLPSILAYQLFSALEQGSCTAVHSTCGCLSPTVASKHAMWLYVTYITHFEITSSTHMKTYSHVSQRRSMQKSAADANFRSLAMSLTDKKDIAPTFRPIQCLLILNAIPESRFFRDFLDICHDSCGMLSNQLFCDIALSPLFFTIIMHEYT